MSTSTLTLNCWVLGSPVDRFLQVQVNQRETFKSIVNAVAEARGLDAKAVDAMQLFLVTSSTPIPTDEDEEEKYEELDEGFRQASKGMKPIRSTKDLSALFKEKLDLHMLHIIVQVPRTIDLCCVMRTASGSRDSLFFITIDDDNTVDDLRQAISDKKRNRRHEGLAFKKNQLSLWAVDLRLDDDRFEENFRNQEFNATTSLKVADQLYTIFPLIDRHCQALHIVVDVTGGQIDESMDLALRGKYIEDNRPQAPSFYAQISLFSEWQNDPAQQIYCGRPQAAGLTIPAMLLHPVYGKFLDDCENLPIDRNNSEFALQLCHAMSDFYPDEANRTNAFWHVFEICTISTTDGHYLSIAEFKNEMVAAGADPYAQAGPRYLEHTRSYAAERLDTPLPCIIVLVFGPYIAFAGAAWGQRPMLQTLSTALPLHHHPSDTKTRAMVVRHLGALRNAIASLDDYYRKLRASSTSEKGREKKRRRIMPSDEILFPYPTSFNGGTQSFQYESQIIKHKLVFLATLTATGEKVCVKFARSYSQEVHSFCAKIGCAQALRSFEPIPGGWLMIVMDAIDDFDELYGCYEVSKSHPIVEAMDEKLNEMHRNDFVHGDIRESNIMVSKDRKGFMFLDFDWAGKMGEVRYPMHVNRVDFPARPDGALDGELILAEHDKEMMQTVKNLRCA